MYCIAKSMRLFTLFVKDLSQEDAKKEVQLVIKRQSQRQG